MQEMRSSLLNQELGVTADGHDTHTEGLRKLGNSLWLTVLEDLGNLFQTTISIHSNGSEAHLTIERHKMPR